MILCGPVVALGPSGSGRSSQSRILSPILYLVVMGDNLTLIGTAGLIVDEGLATQVEISENWFGE